MFEVVSVTRRSIAVQSPNGQQVLTWEEARDAADPTNDPSLQPIYAKILADARDMSRAQGLASYDFDGDGNSVVVLAGDPDLYPEIYRESTRAGAVSAAGVAAK